MKKYLLIFSIILSLLIFKPIDVFATSGACSAHGGVNCAAGIGTHGDNAICNDGYESSTSYYDTDECMGNLSLCAEPIKPYCTSAFDYTRHCGTFQLGTMYSECIQDCQNQISKYQSDMSAYQSCLSSATASKTTTTHIPKATVSAPFFPLVITTASLPDAIVGKPYSVNINFTYAGTKTPVLRLDTFPDGLQFNFVNFNANGGIFNLQLIPRKTGQFTFETEALIDNNKVATRTFSLTVDDPTVETPVVTPLVPSIPAIPSPSIISNSSNKITPKGVNLFLGNPVLPTTKPNSQSKKTLLEESNTSLDDIFQTPTPMVAPLSTPTPSVPAAVIHKTFFNKMVDFFRNIF